VTLRDSVKGKGKIVSQERSRRTRSKIRPSSVASSNVLNFDASRNKLPPSKSHTVFYINENRECAALLESLGDVHVVDIHDPDMLTRKLLIRIPDVIMIESSLQWSDALTTVRQMTDLMAAPVVLLVDRHCQNQAPQLIKKAYAAGVSDTLFLPLDKDEVQRTLNVLLHFQSQASLR